MIPCAFFRALSAAARRPSPVCLRSYRRAPSPVRLSDGALLTAWLLFAAGVSFAAMMVRSCA